MSNGKRPILMYYYFIKLSHYCNHLGNMKYVGTDPKNVTSFVMISLTCPKHFE